MSSCLNRNQDVNYSVEAVDAVSIIVDWKENEEYEVGDHVGKK